MGVQKRGNPTMTTSTVTAMRKGYPQHWVEGHKSKQIGLNRVFVAKTKTAVFPRGSKKRKSNNDNQHGHGQEKRRPTTWSWEKQVKTNRLNEGFVAKVKTAVFPRGANKRKSNNDNTHGHGQEKRRPATLSWERQVKTNRLTKGFVAKTNTAVFPRGSTKRTSNTDI